MADIMLEKPLAGAQNIVDSAAGSNITLGFPIADATLERSGNDLIFHFEDGSSVVLREFYTAYTKDTMPDFVIDGAPVSGEEFFTALNDQDLMPAAGPAASAANAAGGRYHEFTSDALQSGVDRLDGLDLSSNRAFYPERDPFGGALDGDSTALTDAGNPLDPANPNDPFNPLDPDNPLNPDDPFNPNTPNDPGSPTPNTPPVVSVTGAIGVIESGVYPGGNVAYAGVPEMSGVVTATDADGDALTFGFLDADGNQVTEIVTDYGAITMRPDGTYTYTLDNADPDTNSLALGETREETFTVFVDDGNGGVTTQEVTVTIVGTNDQPTLELSAPTLDVIESGVGRDEAGTIITSNIPAEENAPYAGKLTSGTGQAQGADVDHGAVLTYGVASGVTEDPLNAYFTATDSTQGSSSVTAAGAYGDLTLNNDGSYSYALHPSTDANINSLHEGEVVTETFTVYVKDEHGAWSKQELTVNITGTNDRPEISAVDNLVLKETGVQDGGNTPTTPDGAVAPEGDAHRLTATGHVTADDVDNDDDAGTLHYSFDNGQTSLSTALGDITINQNGDYTYQLKDGAANSLAQGETRTETFTVMVTDSHGATHEAVVNVTIYGTNDIPTLSLTNPVLNVYESGVGRDEAGNIVTSNDAHENADYAGTLSASGTAVGDDVDHGASWTYGLGVNGVPQYTDNGAQTAVGEYGTLTLEPNGTYTYTLFPKPDPENAEKYPDGADDPAYARDLALYEKVNSLSEGETHPETFTIYVKDEHGAWTSQTLTVNVVGTNDRPHIDEITPKPGDESLTVKEQGVFGDEEKGENPNKPTSETTGAPDADQHKGSVSGTIHASDPDKDNGSGAQTDGSDNHGLAFSVIGGTSTLDGVKTPFTGLGDEFHFNTYTGTTPGGSATLYHTITTEYGKLTIDENGNYTYTLNDSDDKSNLVNQLGEGQTVTETFTVQVMDQHGATHTETITITVEGTNDIPEMTVNKPDLSIDESTLNPDGTMPAAPTVGGHADVFDVDGGAANDKETLTFGLQFNGTDKMPEWQDSAHPDGEPTYAGSTIGSMTDVTVEGTYGKLTIDKNGNYTYTLDNKKADSLTENEHPVEKFTIYVKDEHGAWTSQEITVTVNGKNDDPVIIAGANPHLVLKEEGVVDTSKEHGDTTPTTEESKLTGDGSEQYSRQGIEGDIKASDVDHGNVLSFSVEYGKTTLTADGSTSETPVTDTPTTSGGGDKATTITTKYGTLTLDQKGHYTYTVNEEGAQALNQGDKVTETFNVTISDGHGGTVPTTITVDVLGSNDRPTIETKVAPGSDHDLTDPGWDGTTEIKGDTVATGTYTGHDDDAGEKLEFNEFGISRTDNDRDSAFEKDGSGHIGNGIHSLDGTYGTLTIDDDGNYKYELDTSKADHLTANDHPTETFYIYVKDDHGAWSRTEVTFTIHGTNDAPVIDPQNPSGSLTIYEEGVWGDQDTVHHKPDETFTPKDQVLEGSFTASDVENDKLTYFLRDIAEGGKLTLTHTAADGSAGGTQELEITNVTTGKDAQGHDIVTGFTTAYGTFQLTTNEDGSCSYTFTADPSNQEALDWLNQGDKLTFEGGIKIGVKDVHGTEATADHTVNIAIVGTNDRPTVTSKELTVKESGVQDGGNIADLGDTTSVQGHLVGSDEDTGDKDSLSYSISAGVKTGDQMSFTYAPFKAGTSAAGLTLTVKDQGALSENDPHHSAGYESFIKTDFGTLYFNAKGDYVFELDDAAVNRLGQGDTVTFHFTGTVTDSHLSTGEIPIKITIQGTNDKPTLALETGSGEHADHAVITADSGAAKDDDVYEKVDDGRDDVATFVVTEEGYDAKGTAVGSDVYTGKAIGGDDDYGHSLFYGLTKYTQDPQNADAAFNGSATGAGIQTMGGTYGTLTIDEHGKYIYTLNEAANALDEGQSGTDTFSIFVRDEHGAWAVQNVAFDVQGSNDAPIVTDSSLSLREEGAHRSGNYTWHAHPADNYGTNGDGHHTVSFTGHLESSVTIVDNGDTIKGYSLTPPVDKDHPFTSTQDGIFQILKNDFLTITLNTETGDYKAVLDMDAANEWQEKYDKKYEKSYDFTVTVTDSDDLTASANLNVKLFGANDLPTLTVENTGNTYAVTEDHPGTATGTFSATDPDNAREDLSFFIFDPQAKNVNGEAYTEANFTKWMSDHQNEFSASTSGNPGTDKILSTPKDSTYGNSIHGTYGTLTITKDTDGTIKYEYKLDDASTNPLLQALGHGEEAKETFSILVKDPAGSFDIKDVHFTVTGSADGVKLTSTDAHVLQVTEAGVFPGGNVAKDVDADDGGTFTVRPVDNPGEHGEHLVFGFQIGDQYVKAGWTEDGAFTSEPIKLGDYGTLTITGIKPNGDGTWSASYSFHLDNSSLAVQSLREGELIKNGLKLAVWDDRHPVTENGQPSMPTTQGLDLYIHGTNDRPYFTNGDGLGEDDKIVILSAGSISEDGSHLYADDGGTLKNVLTGTLTGDDYDDKSVELTYSLVDGGNLVHKMAGHYGVLELNTDGTYTYTLTEAGRAELQKLHAGETLDAKTATELGLKAEIFPVRVTDSHGAFDDGNLVIRIDGETDKPVPVEVKNSIYEDSGHIINHEATDPSISGNLPKPDVIDAVYQDKGENVLSWTVKDYPGTWGELTVTADGKYTYTLTENANMQAWNKDFWIDKNGTRHEGQAQESFDVEIRLPNGDTITQHVTITVQGTNDRPYFDVNTAPLEGEVTRNVFEEPGANTGDYGEGAVTGVVFTGELGGAHDIDDPEGKLAYMLWDEASGKAVTELKTPYGTIVLHYTTDPVTGEITTHYTYTLDNESTTLAEALKGGSLDDIIKIVAVDPHNANSVVKDAEGNVIEGTRDLIIHINDNKGGSGEDPGFEFDAKISDLKGTVTEDGGTADHPEGSQSVVGHLYTKFSGADDGSGKDDGSPERVFGIVEKVYDAETDSWIDNPNGGQAQGHVASDGKYGYIVVDPVTGEYKYTLYNGEDGDGKNPVQSLAAGETVTETFTLMLNGKVVTDGEGNPVTIDITIHGTNDKPTLSVEQPKAISEAPKGGLQNADVDGHVTGFDIDHKLDENGRPIQATDKNGNPLFDVSGKPIYETEDVTYHFRVDGVTSTVIGGVTHEILTTSYGTVDLNTETGTYTYHLDVSKLASLSQEALDKLGVQRSGEEGSYTYHLPEGSSLKETFQIVANDGTSDSEPGTITVTINGTNWGPEINTDAVTTYEVHEDAVGVNERSSFEGNLNSLFTDDQGAGNLTYTIKESGGTFYQGKYGSLELVGGKYIYVLNNESKEVQGLSADTTEKFTISVKDERGEWNEVTITVTVHGKQDIPTLSVDRVLTVREGDAVDSDSGHATGLDKDFVDQAEGALHYCFGKVGNEYILSTDVTDKDGKTFGTLTINESTGEYTFKLDNKSDYVKALKPGELKELFHDVFVYDSADNVGTARITIDIIGANTAPEELQLDHIQNVDTPLVEGGTTDQDTVFTGTAHAVDKDAESPEPTYGFLVDGKVVQSFHGKYGTFTINKETGDYTYTLDADGKNADLNALAEDQRETDTIKIVAVDEYGAQSQPQDVTVTIKGTNDAPKIDTDTVNDDMSGTFTFSDVDANDGHSVTFNGLYANKEKAPITVDLDTLEDGTDTVDVYNDSGVKIGTLTLTYTKGTGAQDSLTYSFAPDKDYQQSMNHGVSTSVKFTVSVDDGHTGGNVDGKEEHTFTVKSTNAAPVLGTAEGNNQGSLTVTDNDGDTIANVKVTFGDQHITLTQGNSSTVNGVTFSYDGSKLTYAVDASHTDIMAPGATGSLKFSVTLDDEHGTVTYDNVSVPISSTNKAPTIESNTQTPNADAHHLEGHILASDDHTDSADLTFSVANHGTYGTVDVFDDGTYTYTLNEGVPDGTAKDSFTINVSDGHGGVTSTTINVDLSALNTAPDLDPDRTSDTSTSITLDDANVTGELHVTDDNGDNLSFGNRDSTQLTSTNGAAVSAVITNGVVTYTYTLGEHPTVGSDSFTLTVSDGYGGTAQITVNVDVSAAAPHMMMSNAFSLMSVMHPLAETVPDTTHTSANPSEDSLLPGSEGHEHSGEKATDATNSSASPENHGTDVNHTLRPTDATPPSDENGPHDPDGRNGHEGLTDHADPLTHPLDASHTTEDVPGDDGTKGSSSTSADGQSHTPDNPADHPADAGAQPHTLGDDTLTQAHHTGTDDSGSVWGHEPNAPEGYALFGDVDEYDVPLYGPVEGSDYGDGVHVNGYYGDNEALTGIGVDLFASQDTLEHYLPGSVGSESASGVEAPGVGGAHDGLSLTGGGVVDVAGDVPAQMPGLIPADAVVDHQDIAIGVVTGTGEVADDNLAHTVAIQQQQHGNG